MKTNNDTIFTKCQYLRMKSELEETEKLIAECVPYVVSEEDKLGEKIKKHTKNILYREARTKELESKRAEILALIEQFKEDNPKFDTDNFSEEEFLKSAGQLFKRDKFDINRELLGVSIVLDSKYKYVLADDGLKKLSSLLYENENALFEIKKSLEKIYVCIHKKTISTKQETVLVGLGAAMLGLVGAIFGSGVASLAGSGLVALCACVAGGALVGATYVTMSEGRRKRIKEEFAKLSLDESASLLAIRCHVIGKLKKDSEEKNVKDEISDLLTLTDDLRSDVAYKIFVENEDSEENKAKLKMFHNFDDALIEILA